MYRYMCVYFFEAKNQNQQIEGGRFHKPVCGEKQYNELPMNAIDNVTG